VQAFASPRRRRSNSGRGPAQKPANRKQAPRHLDRHNEDRHHHHPEPAPPERPRQRHELSVREIWDRVERNCQNTALAQNLIEPGERFSLTRDQFRSYEELVAMLNQRKRRMLLVAPTGAGKTEVLMRIALDQHLASNRATVIIAPTRDLSRQHFGYLSDRLQDTGIEVVEIHSGVPPGKRLRDLDDAIAGRVGVVVGSAMLLHKSNYRRLLGEAGMVIIDDANAFDERQDLSHLRGLERPCLFATATPKAIGRFLELEGAYKNTVEIKTMPFASPQTEIHRVEAAFSENVFSQLDRALDFIRTHMERESRVYVISRTRVKVAPIALYLEDRLGIPVAQLHGEMADTKEHKRRKRTTSSVWSSVPETRTDMMHRFKHNLPSILVATNLVGSGLDIPMADLIVITDADHFSESEMEQLIGRVGRRERESDAVLITGTVLNREAGATVRGKSQVVNGRVVTSFGSFGRGRRGRRR
jgi:RecG-like helicase